MKNRAGIIVLTVLSVVLAVTLLIRHKQAVEQQQAATDRILTLSNNWVEASANLDEQRQVNVALEKELTERRAEVLRLTNDLVQTTENLNKTSADLEAARKVIAERDAKIADLEAQNQSLDRQALELSMAITNLNAQIAETEKKLAAAEGDKTFLQAELKRLMAEKAELERKFNDLAVLRAQVRQLKEELAISRRLEWIRKGLFADTDQKGAQKLMTPSKPSASEAGRATHYDLNVEVGADGSVRVIPPLTNRPAATNPERPN